MQNPFLPIALLALALFGCVNPTIEDRLACIQLTSYAFISVPECSSQEECFLAVQQSFQFEAGVFHSQTRDALFEAQNRLARSWLFLNGEV